MADPHSHTPAPAAESHSASPAHADHGAHDHGSYLHHVRPYLIVGAALFIFTAVTVGLSYVRFEEHRTFRWVFSNFGVQGYAINIAIGLAVATFKVCLVGAWFMHLKNEKSVIWRPLIFTFIFCAGLFTLFLLAYYDPIRSTSHPLH